jgi:CHAT domain-containing protein
VRGADTIFLSPDGPLHQFPFAALPGSRPDQYLLEERNFIIAPVPRLLPQLLAGATDLSTGRQPSAPLLIGDVDFDSTGYPARMQLAQSETEPLTGQHRSAIRGEKGLAQFARLPGTAREIQSIGALYRESGAGEPLLISGTAATEEAFRREAPRHRWVHIATHGFFAPETVPSALGQSAGEAGRSPGMLFGSANEVRGYHPGLLSGIVFAGANPLSRQPQSAMPGSGERDEGIMTALEVSGLDLSSVDLVVLSACETGLGKTAGGEGVLGLQRAFQIAGAKNVIASLWKVDDAATAVLMRLFYQKLWREKKSPSAALRESQLWILNHPDQIPTQTPARGANFGKVVELPGNGKQSESHKRSSPYLWAGFLISGAGQ